MRRVIYLDNAATANPKAPGVGAAMARSLGDCNGNPGHGGHRSAVAATLAVFAARASLARLLGVSDPARLVFTSGATAALNQAIWGSLPPGPAHVVCGTWEHNAVLRPLWAWRRRTGGTVTVLPGDAVRPLRAEDVEAALRPHTALIAISGASNVTGALAPVAEVAEVARARGVRLLVDGAQVAGHLPLRLDALGADLWVAAGHKGLLGPQGVGVLYLRPGLELDPLLQGGAGFDSEREAPPEAAPERYEAGTLNTPGILGLGAAADYLLGQDLRELRRREVEHLAALTAGLGGVAGIRTFAAADPRLGVGVVSCTVDGWDPGEAAAVLDRSFDIAVRSGLHCAPLAHRALGTAPTGTVRISTGPFTTSSDIAAVISALAWLAGHPQPAGVGGAALARA